MMSRSSGTFCHEKVIIREGYGKCKPTEFSECCVVLTLEQPKNASPDAVKSVGYELDKEIKISVGHGITHIACTVDLCVLTMFEGEMCRLRTKCTAEPEAAEDVDFFTLELTLLSFVAADDVHSTSYENKMVRAVTLKDLGTAAFIGGSASAAFQKFSRSLKYIACAEVQNDKPVASCGHDSILLDGGDDGNKIGNESHPDVTANGHVSDLSSFTCEDIARLTCQCWLNLAACQLRYRNFKMAAVNCSKALDIYPDSVKALFRRAQCNIKTGNEHTALADLERAITLEPGNREVKRLLVTARQLTREGDDKLAAALSKMFR